MTKNLKTDVIIIGFNNITQTVIEILALINKYAIIGILDVNESIITAPTISGFKVFSKLEDMFVSEHKNKIPYAIICVEANNHRKEVVECIEKSYPELTFINLVHPSAVLGKQVVLKRGTIIGARTVINSQCALGEFCIVNNQVSIGHDCNIENFVRLKTNTTIGGHVCIGNYSSIDVNSKIIQNIKIGENCIIKKNTLVLKDVLQDSILEGVPGKIED